MTGGEILACAMTVLLVGAASLPVAAVVLAVVMVFGVSPALFPIIWLSITICCLMGCNWRAVMGRE